MTLLPRECKNSQHTCTEKSGHGFHHMEEEQRNKLGLYACVHREARRIEAFQPTPTWTRPEPTQRYTLCPGSPTANCDKQHDACSGTWLRLSDHDKHVRLAKKSDLEKAVTPQRTAQSLDFTSVSSTEGNHNGSCEFLADISISSVCSSTAATSDDGYKQRHGDFTAVLDSENLQSDIDCIQSDVFPASDTNIHRNTTTAKGNSVAVQAENACGHLSELTGSPGRANYARSREASEDDKDEGFCSSISCPDATKKDGGISDFSSNSNVDADKMTRATEELHRSSDVQRCSLGHLHSSPVMEVKDDRAHFTSRAASLELHTGSKTGQKEEDWEGNFSDNRKPGPMSMGKRPNRGRGRGSTTTLYKTRLRAVSKEREDLVSVGRVAEDCFVPNTLFPKRRDLHSKPCSLHGPNPLPAAEGRRGGPQTDWRHEMTSDGPVCPCPVHETSSPHGEEGGADQGGHPGRPHCLGSRPLENWEFSRSQPYPNKHRQRHKVEAPVNWRVRRDPLHLIYEIHSRRTTVHIKRPLHSLTSSDNVVLNAHIAYRRCPTSNLDPRLTHPLLRPPTGLPRPCCTVDGPRLIGDCCESLDIEDIDVREVTPPRQDGNHPRQRKACNALADDDNVDDEDDAFCNCSSSMKTACRRLFELDTMRTLRPVGEVTGDSPGLLQSAIEELVSTPLDTLVHYARLGKFHRQLYQEDKMVDVLIQVEEAVYVAHRAVLACHSHYFSTALLAQDCVTLPLEVKLCGVGAPTFEVFLTFAYTGTLTFDPQTLAHAVLASELLQVPELKAWCDDVVKTMTLEQAVLILCCSRDIEDTVVYAEALNMALQHFSQATELQSFLALDVDTVMRLLGSDGACVGSELEVFRAALLWLGHASEQRRDCLEQVLSTVRFALMSPPDIFQCMAASSLAQDRERVVDLIVRGNWVSTARLLRQPDPLGLPVPEPRLSLRHKPSHRFGPLACQDDVCNARSTAVDNVEFRDHVFKDEAVDGTSQGSRGTSSRRERRCQACVCCRHDDVPRDKCQHAVCRGEDGTRNVCSLAPRLHAAAQSKGTARDSCQRKRPPVEHQGSKNRNNCRTPLGFDPYSDLGTEGRSLRLDNDWNVQRRGLEGDDGDGRSRRIPKHDACFQPTRSLGESAYHKQRNGDDRARMKSVRQRPAVVNLNSMFELDEGREVTRTECNFDIKYRQSSPLPGLLLPSTDRQSAGTSLELSKMNISWSPNGKKQSPNRSGSSAERGASRPDCDFADRPSRRPRAKCDTTAHSPGTTDCLPQQ